MIDYLEIAQEYHGQRNDGFLTDAPIPIQLSSDDYVRVRYDGALDTVSSIEDNLSNSKEGNKSVP